jgi:hypothetical protein
MPPQCWPYTAVDPIPRPRAEHERDGRSPTREVGTIKAARKEIVAVAKVDLFDRHFLPWRIGRSWFFAHAPIATAE